MEIINKKVGELIPYENNPRNNDEAVEYVAASIREFGFKVPIVIDSDGVIVAGHTRLKAALKLGLDEVPCIVADDLTPEQVTAFRLADNKVSEQATWNVDKLLEEIGKTEIDLSAFSFDLDELGDAILEETEEEQFERQKREFEERMAAGKLSEDSEEYQEFLKKFEAKKTTDPELYRRAKAANAEFEKGMHKELPKYAYPLELVTAAAVALYSKYGIEFSVSRAESYRVTALDQQRKVGKAIFGAGYLISEREKAEREKAEREKAEREKTERWELSDREWEIVRSLGKR